MVPPAQNRPKRRQKQKENIPISIVPKNEFFEDIDMENEPKSLNNPPSPSLIKKESNDYSHYPKQVEIRQLKFDFDDSDSQESDKDKDKNTKKMPSMIFFKRNERKQLEISQTFTTNKYPLPFKEDFIRQCDKRLLNTYRTTYRGKILGQINCINLGSQNRLNDLLDTETINQQSQEGQNYPSQQEAKYNKIYQYERNTMPQNVLRQKVQCNCTKTQCLQKYCECFSIGELCHADCKCKDCHNNPQHEEQRNEIMQQIKQKDENAFQPKVLFDDQKDDESQHMIHNKGCHCSKSNCLKKYCDCYKTGVKCTDQCHCKSCKNKDPPFMQPIEENLLDEKLMKQSNKQEQTLFSDLAMQQENLNDQEFDQINFSMMAFKNNRQSQSLEIKNSQQDEFNLMNSQKFHIQNSQDFFVRKPQINFSQISINSQDSKMHSIFAGGSQIKKPKPLNLQNEDSNKLLERFPSQMFESFNNNKMSNITKIEEMEKDN